MKTLGSQYSDSYKTTNKLFTTEENSIVMRANARITFVFSA